MLYTETILNKKMIVLSQLSIIYIQNGKRIGVGNCDYKITTRNGILLIPNPIDW